VKISRYADVRGKTDREARVRELLEDLTRGQQAEAVLALTRRLNVFRRHRDRLTAQIIDQEQKLRRACAHPLFALEHQEHEYVGAGGRRETFEIVSCDVCGCTLFRDTRFV
jgi:ribosomal protein L18